MIEKIVYRTYYFVKEGYMATNSKLHYSFDSMSDGILRDLSGNNNDGIIYGDPCCILGVHGKGLQFSGNNDRIDCGNSNTLQCTDAFSFSAWISTEPDEAGCIISKGYDFGVNGSFFLRHSDGYLGFVVLGHEGYQMCWSEQVKIDDWQWHHIAGVYDGKNGKLNVYVDGKQVNSSMQGTGVPRRLNISESNVIIGAGPDGHFRGMMNEIRLFDRALQPSEIVILADEFTPNLVAPMMAEC